MGGVDNLSRVLVPYALARKGGIKWYRKLGEIFIDFCIYNSFVMYKRLIPEALSLTFNSATNLSSPSSCFMSMNKAVLDQVHQKPEIPWVWKKGISSVLFHFNQDKGKGKGRSVFVVVPWEKEGTVLTNARTAVLVCVSKNVLRFIIQKTLCSGL